MAHPPAASDDAAADFYETAVDYLGSLGIERYEISNFAKRGHESLHNLKYWRMEPYTGFGSDAHSFDGCERREKCRICPGVRDSDARSRDANSQYHSVEPG